MSEKIGRNNISKEKEQHIIKGEAAFAGVLHGLSTRKKTEIFSYVPEKDTISLGQIAKKTYRGSAGNNRELRMAIENEKSRLRPTIMSLIHQEIPLIVYSERQKLVDVREISFTKVGALLVPSVIPIAEAFHAAYPQLPNAFEHQAVPMHYALITALRQLQKQPQEKGEIESWMRPYLSIFQDKKTTTNGTLQVLERQKLVYKNRGRDGIERIGLTKGGRILWNEFIAPAREAVKNSIVSYQSSQRK
jgi:hypothetical protein